MVELALAGDRPPRSPEAALVVLRGGSVGRKIALDHAPFTIGSDGSCSLVLDGEGIAGEHCVLASSGERWRLDVVREAAAVRVGDDPCASATLQHRVRIEIGAAVLCFLDDRHGTLESEYFGILYDLATTDPLTGVHSRRFTEELLEQELKHGASVGLVVLAIDCAEELPATTHDPVSRTIADVLREHCRNDTRRVGVIGTLRFAVLFRDATLEHARLVAGELREAVTLALRSGRSHLTVRTGAAVSDPMTGRTAAALWSAAEADLRR